MTTFTLPSVNGEDTLHGIMVSPAGTPRGMVQIVHGMAEYIERYLPLMEFLAARGYLCFGHDHTGHGKSQPDAALLGHLDYAAGAHTLIEDVIAVRSYIGTQYPSLPCVLLGHSMGSFIVRCVITVTPEQYAGLVISGTGGSQPTGLGKAITALLRCFKGAAARSPFLYRMMFGAYNRRFTENSDYAWLSRNPDNVQKYTDDPLCGVMFTVGGMHALLTVNGDANSHTCFSHTPSIPILLISGLQDPVGNDGKGVEQVYRRYREMGLTDVTLHLIPDDRHEIFNETDRAAVMTVVSDWIETHVG